MVERQAPQKEGGFVAVFALAPWHGYSSRRPLTLAVDERPPNSRRFPYMKRTLSVLTAALFATVLSAPAFAADMAPAADASPAAMASPAASDSSSSSATTTDTSSSSTPTHHHRHHHHKKSSSTESSSSTDSSAPAAASSPAMTEPTTK